ncbi:MAG: hypothetical protein J6Y85_02845 [Alphaproteobacteria bacterium]|nr:hypothetical protein [Alphaproteobacteria bacterium]
MQYTVKSSEIMGFLGFIMDAKQEMKGDALYELRVLLQDIDKGTAQQGHQTLSSTLLYHVPELNSVLDIQNLVVSYCKTDVENAGKLNELIQSTYLDYQKIYAVKSELLTTYAQNITALLNQKNGAIAALKNVGQFYGWHVEPDHEMLGYVYPSSESGGSSLSQENGTFQVVGVRPDQYDLTDPQRQHNQLATWFHESVHGVFEESGAEKTLLAYLKQPGNRLVQYMVDHPEFRRKPQENPLESARALIDESLTTAFQGLFEREKLGGDRPVLYQNPVFDFMAHKMMEVLPEQIKAGKVFDINFIAQFEKEFLNPIAQVTMQETIQKKLRKEKCKEAVIRYLKESFAQQKCSFPQNFFAPKGDPAYRVDNWRVANMLLETFTPYIDSGMPIDEKLLQKIEQQHPQIKTQVSELMTHSVYGVLSMSARKGKASSTSSEMLYGRQMREKINAVSK